MTTRTWVGVLSCLAVSACYTPRGAFVSVEDFPAPTAKDYVISYGDTLNVRVFQQDALSTTARVRADGKLSLPLVNEVQASGKTPTVLAAELALKFKDFINNPVVTVGLQESRPLSVSVVGEVIRPGVVILEPGSGVMQALAAAGGLTDFAHRNGIFVVRHAAAGAQPTRVHFIWEKLSRGEGKAPAFTLYPGDAVVAE